MDDLSKNSKHHRVVENLGRLGAGKRSTRLERFPAPLSMARLVRLNGTCLFRFAPEIRIFFLGSLEAKKPLRILKGYIASL